MRTDRQFRTIAKPSQGGLRPHELCERGNAQQLFGFAAGGFRDFTRIAGSHPEMWRDIFLDNRAALVGELDAYVAKLGALRALLEAGDASALEDMLEVARNARNDWVLGTVPGAAREKSGGTK